MGWVRRHRPPHRFMRVHECACVCMCACGGNDIKDLSRDDEDGTRPWPSVDSGRPPGPVAPRAALSPPGAQELDSAILGLRVQVIVRGG